QQEALVTHDMETEMRRTKERKTKTPSAPAKLSWASGLSRRAIAFALLLAVALGWIAEGLLFEFGKYIFQKFHPAVEMAYGCVKTEGMKACTTRLFVKEAQEKPQTEKP